jgi:hypothetical protein
VVGVYGRYSESKTLYLPFINRRKNIKKERRRRQKTRGRLEEINKETNKEGDNTQRNYGDIRCEF